MPYRLPRAPEGFRRSICGFGAGGSLHRHNCVFRMHRYLSSLPRDRQLVICWQRLQLRRIYLLGLIELREGVGPSSEGTRRVPSQRPDRVASVGYLSCKVKGIKLHFVHRDVVYVMFKVAIRRRERDDNIPLPVLPCSRASRQAIQCDASSQSVRELSDIDQTVRVQFLTIRRLPYAVGNPHIRRRFRSRLDQNVLVYA